MRELALALALALTINNSKIKDSSIIDACTSTDDPIVKKYVDACTSTDDIIVKNHVHACTSTDDLIVENHADACTSTDDLIVKNHVMYWHRWCTNENELCTNENDDSDDKPGNNDNNHNKPGNNANKPGNKDKNDNKPGKNVNKDNKQGNKNNDNKPVNNDNKESRQMNFAISLRKRFLNNITKIIKLVDELNDEIYDDDQWLVFAQLNKINPLVDELIDRVWLMIYNKKREKNEIINISVDKDKDIEGYVNIYNEIVDDKLEFVNGISELFDNAIEKKKFCNLKDDVLKLIGNSCICDVKRKGCKKDNNKEKDSDDSEHDNNNDDNNDNDSENDNYNDNDNLIDILLKNKNDKLHNFSDKVLNKLLPII